VASWLSRARKILGPGSPGTGTAPGAAPVVPRGGPRGGPAAGILRSGVPDAPAVGTAEWRQVAAAWSVAEESGAPLAACLRATADSARAAQQARRDQAVALSGPVSTARVVLALPVVGLLMGLLLGFDTLAVLVGRPVGWFCLAGAGGLIAAARAWNARLVRRATPSDAVPGLDLELLAVALSGGGSWTSARRRVDDALAEFCDGFHDASPADEIETLVDLSEGAGVPAAALLRAAADERRRDARARSAVAAERLGIALMLPLGVCILPAFLLVGVVPLFVALLSSTGFGAA
jgi:tight adherence protein B